MANLKEIQIVNDDDQKRVDKFLIEKLEISFSLAQKFVREGKVKVNNKKVKPNYRLLICDKVFIYGDLKNRTKIEKNRANVSRQQIEKFFSYIIFEDENIIAINKPSGVSVQGRSMKNTSIDDILYHLKKEGVIFNLVHRIDRDTSGILILTKNKKATIFFNECFKYKKITKKYLALVYGEVKKGEGEINIALKKRKIGNLEKVYPDFESGQEATSKYIVAKRFAGLTLLEFFPITGRTHQLRVHAKEIGHAIINDFKYGGKKVLMQDISPRLCLHASQIKIDDYFGKKLEINAPKPDFI